MIRDPGKLFIVSSPSGGGKTTVIREAMQRNPGLRYSVSATTRAPRNSERSGIDYLFMTPEAFEANRRAGAFLEWARVYGDCYGTLKKPVIGWMEEGRKILLDLDVQGAAAVKKQIPESVLVFLLPPSLSVLRGRLEKRGTDSAEAIARRLQRSQEEMGEADNYDFVIFNERLEDAVSCLLAVIRNSN